MTANPTRTDDLAAFIAVLQEQHGAKLDVVAPAADVTAADGRLVLNRENTILTDDGVTTLPTTSLDLSAGAIGDLADRLGIPPTYLRRCHADRLDLFDANVNGWLAPDPRSFLLRSFVRGTGAGWCRAVLSDRYRIVDNLDVAFSVLEGIRGTGAEVRLDTCDLTDNRMVMRFYCPQVAVRAPELLANYRSPFGGGSGADLPVVWAGFQVTNSETGGGALAITPRIVVQVCKNGMTRARDAVRSVHLGERLAEGEVQWSDATRQLQVELIRSMVTDAVTTFLSPAYVEAAVEQWGEAARTVLPDPVKAIAEVSKALRYTDAQQASILSFFTQGGDVSAFGVAQAMTAAARASDNPDTAYVLEQDVDRALAVLAK